MRRVALLPNMPAVVAVNLSKIAGRVDSGITQIPDHPNETLKQNINLAGQERVSIHNNGPCADNLLHMMLLYAAHSNVDMQ